jgi:hypothetical protein
MSTRHTVFVLLFLCHHLYSSAQQKLYQAISDSTKFNNRYYKQELGLGVDQILNRVIGTSLIWKIRDDRSKMIPVTYAYYWRLRGAINSSTNTGYRDTISVPPYYFDRISPAESYTNIWLSIGREKVNFFNRINMYYGWDAGPYGGYQYVGDRSSYYVFNQFSGQYDVVLVNNTQKSLNLGLSGEAFFGLKYHFSQRISVSAECALQLYYGLTNRKTRTKINQKEDLSKNLIHDFGANMKYLRFVTVR